MLIMRLIATEYGDKLCRRLSRKVAYVRGWKASHTSHAIKSDAVPMQPTIFVLDSH